MRKTNQWSIEQKAAKPSSQVAATKKPSYKLSADDVSFIRQRLRELPCWQDQNSPSISYWYADPSSDDHVRVTFSCGHDNLHYKESVIAVNVERREVDDKGVYFVHQTSALCSEGDLLGNHSKHKKYAYEALQKLKACYNGNKHWDAVRED